MTRGCVSTAVPVRAALLETRGARTGRTRRTATLYFHDGDRVILVAALRRWPRQYADFRGEAARTGRVIPLVRLVPR